MIMDAKSINTLEALRRYHESLRNNEHDDAASNRLINELEVIYQEFYKDRLT